MLKDGRKITGGDRTQPDGIWKNVWDKMTPAERRATVTSATPGRMVNGKWVTKNDH